MHTEASDFVHWMGRHEASQMLPSFVKTIGHIKELPTPDLIAIMYHGVEAKSSLALAVLQDRFRDEMQALNEQGEQSANSWN